MALLKSGKNYFILSAEKDPLTQSKRRDCTPRSFASRHIKKVWEVDPLICPKGVGEMKIISFITESDVARKILAHLELGVFRTFAVRRLITGG
jgi:hypothetical protein